MATPEARLSAPHRPDARCATRLHHYRSESPINWELRIGEISLQWLGRLVLPAVRRDVTMRVASRAFCPAPGASCRPYDGAGARGVASAHSVDAGHAAATAPTASTPARAPRRTRRLGRESSCLILVAASGPTRASFAACVTRCPIVPWRLALAEAEACGRTTGSPSSRRRCASTSRGARHPRRPGLPSGPPVRPPATIVAPTPLQGQRFQRVGSIAEPVRHRGDWMGVTPAKAPPAEVALATRGAVEGSSVTTRSRVRPP
jgi:hypothetical protein